MSFKKTKTLILSSSDIQEIMSKYGLDWLMGTLIERLSNAIKNFDSQKISIPVRGGFYYEKPKAGLIEWMPLYKQGDEVLLKVVGYHPSNPRDFNLPTIISTISVYDAESGHLTAMMDGVLATALRTGAASAVASEFMASKDSSVLGLIGCGTQAVTQVHALSHKFSFEKILIYDIDSETLSTFEKRCSVLDLNVEFIISSVDEIVENSDILCTATSVEIGSGPLFSDLETKPHLHINAVGSDFPGKMEIPLELLQKSFVCPDFTEQAIIEGECQQLKKQEIGADFVELVQNSEKFNHLKKERSVFDSTGWALEDKVVMDLFLDCALELGLGQELEIEHMSEDTKNPYDFMNSEVKLEDVHIRKAIGFFTA